MIDDAALNKRISEVVFGDLEELRSMVDSFYEKANNLNERIVAIEKKIGVSDSDNDLIEDYLADAYDRARDDKVEEGE